MSEKEKEKSISEEVEDKAMDAAVKAGMPVFFILLVILFFVVGMLATNGMEKELPTFSFLMLLLGILSFAFLLSSALAFITGVVTYYVSLVWKGTELLLEEKRARGKKK